ncbi:class I SAM-dependent methyltransferase [uncultured Flavobacterium sp.]|uniref:class I SAM-dependent methyltransferase n=1 Tax=uncultured Flavobacterium sp. TaxID=165435 RepID=UPI0025FEA9D9|nr:class I SAM-dependent methyltransferase [uncultured Flavobacterium sp.]
MKKEDNYLEINKNGWNRRTEVHVDSQFYDMAAFLDGKNTLNAPELALLGDVTGKKILHLQCHFGQDTISLSRMGAIATGMDLSDKAIEKGRELATKLGTGTRFICCNVYDLPNHLDEQFDIVFTSYGTIGWLPDLAKWAGIVSQCLKPGGKFVFAEFHPVVWMFDNNFEKVQYNYFKGDAIIETEFGTYADVTAPIEYEMVSWNHALSEVITALLAKGLEIHSFNEYDYSPYNCFNGTEEFEPGKFRIASFGNKIPMMYTLLAVKKQ